MWGLQAEHYGATSSYTGEGRKFVQENPKAAAAIAIGFVATPVLAVASAEAGPVAVGSFLLNEVKDEALSQVTGGASDVLDLSKGITNLVKGAIKKVDNALDAAIPDSEAALITGGAKKSSERIERYMSKAEADLSIDAGGLVPGKTPHQNQPKWIAIDGTRSRKRGLRLNKANTNKTTFNVEQGTIDWLKKNYEKKPTNEPNSFRLPADKISGFNNKVNKVTTIKLK